MIPSLIFLTANSLSNSTPQSPNPSMTLCSCRHFAGADTLPFCDPAGGGRTDCGWKRGAEGRVLGSHVCPGLTPLDFASRQHDRQLIGESGICQDTSSINSHYFSSSSASLLPFPHTSPPPLSTLNGTDMWRLHGASSLLPLLHQTTTATTTMTATSLPSSKGHTEKSRLDSPPLK